MSAPQPEKNRAKDLKTVYRRTTTRRFPGEIRADKDYSEDKPAHVMRSFPGNLQRRTVPALRSEFTPCLLNVSRFMHRIASLIIKFMIRTWKINNKSNREIRFPDPSSLDAITRQLPDGYYSTFRTFEGCRRVLGLKSHLQRLYGPVAAPQADESSLRRHLRALLEAYRPGEARVRLVMTSRGETYIAIEPLKPLPREVYEEGVRVETAEIQRNTPRLKSTAFIGASDDERKHLARIGIFEALLVKRGKILEGMTSNFFYILDCRAERASTSLRSAQHDVLYTARNDILLGVTRTMVIHVARGRGVEVGYRALELSQLPAVKEAFITSSSRGIVPVVQIDGVQVGRGRVGRITKLLMTAYEEHVLQHAEKI